MFRCSRRRTRRSRRALPAPAGCRSTPRSTRNTGLEEGGRLRGHVGSRSPCCGAFGCRSESKEESERRERRPGHLDAAVGSRHRGARDMGDRPSVPECRRARPVAFTLFRGGFALDPPECFRSRIGGLPRTGQVFRSTAWITPRRGVRYGARSSSPADRPGPRARPRRSRPRPGSDRTYRSRARPRRP